MNTELFIQKSKEIHGNKYNYDKVEYIHSQKNVIIVCKAHGDFSQSAHNHMAGCGCIKCGIDNKRTTTKEFIKKAIKIHKNKYDYSKVEYKNSSEKVVFICPDHGEFRVTPNSFLAGFGCNECSKNETYDNNKIEFIKKAKKIYKNKYDYSKAEYKGSIKKVIIICPEHGEFEKRPDSFLAGFGCNECKKKIR